MMQQLEVQKVKVKKSDIKDAVINRLDASLKEQAKQINIEQETQHLINTDALCAIYKNLSFMYPKLEEVFQDHLKSRIREIKPSYRTSTRYSDRQVIEDRITEYLLNNEKYTFDSLYLYVTQGLNKCVNTNELEVK